MRQRRDICDKTITNMFFSWYLIYGLNYFVHLIQIGQIVNQTLHTLMYLPQSTSAELCITQISSRRLTKSWYSPMAASPLFVAFVGSSGRAAGTLLRILTVSIRWLASYITTSPLRFTCDWLRSNWGLKIPLNM